MSENIDCNGIDRNVYMDCDLFWRCYISSGNYIVLHRYKWVKKVFSPLYGYELKMDYKSYSLEPVLWVENQNIIKDIE